MNTPTLSQLADIGAKAAHKQLGSPNYTIITVGRNGESAAYAEDQPAREAFVKAVLDAIGYKLPVDPEREAFDAWVKDATCIEGGDRLFEAWKAGRDVLRKYRQERAREALDDIIPQTAKPTLEANPPWIEWKGGPCPIPDTVERWEYKLGDGMHRPAYGPPRAYADKWEHAEGCGKMYHITAYRVLDWGTTKQPE